MRCRTVPIPAVDDLVMVAPAVGARYETTDSTTLEMRVLVSHCGDAGEDPSRSGSGHPRRADAVLRARLRGDDDRGDQRALGCPAGHRVPTVLVQARGPQGTSGCLDRR